MVSTRRGRIKMEMAGSCVETHPNIVTKGHPRRCSDTGPHGSSSNSPLWLGRSVKQARSGLSILRTPTRVLKDSDLNIQESRHENSSPIPNLETFQQAEDRLPEKSTTSLNITEFARRHQDDNDDDLDEVQSALDPAFATVNGHRVKKEYVPLLNAIFLKYGDITRECEGKPPAIVSIFLEQACSIFERLKGMKFSQAAQKDLKEMLDEVCFLESQKLTLGWLHEKLQYICETKTSFHNYLTVKEEEKRSIAMISELKTELSLIEGKLVVEMAQFDQIKKRALGIRAKVGDLWTQSLVHGLL